MREKIKDSGGYTLVELIIVIAIIAIMSGAGALTIGSIRTAQATASMQKFDAELSTLEAKTKSQGADTAILVERDGANYNVYYGTCTSNSAADFVPGATARASVTPDAVLERVTIYYSDTYSADSETSEMTSVLIKIRKSDSQVLSGAGEYKFVKYRSDMSVGRVTLNGYTGGHTYGKN